MVNFFILLIILTFSSDSLNLSDGNNRENFFPIQIGNRWYYSSYGAKHSFDSTRVDEIWEIKSLTRETEDKIFFLLEKKFLRDEKTVKIDSIYICLSNDSLLTLKGGESSPKIIAVFNKKEYKIDKEQVRLREKSNSVITFNYYIPNTRDYSHWKTFKKKVGIIDEHSSWGIGTRLIKYEIK